jgi:hypothetical protein
VLEDGLASPLESGVKIVKEIGVRGMITRQGPKSEQNDVFLAQRIANV